MNREGIKSHPDKVVAIREWPTPRNAKDVRSFLGLAGFYHKFVKNFADTAAPLTSLLKKTAKWQWQDEQERAFQKLKDDLATSTTLAHPDTT